MSTLDTPTGPASLEDELVALLEDHLRGGTAATRLRVEQFAYFVKTHTGCLRSSTRQQLLQAGMGEVLYGNVINDDPAD